MWGWRQFSTTRSPVTRAGSFVFSGPPCELSNGAICSMVSLWAPPGRWALTLNLLCCRLARFLGSLYLWMLQALTAWWSRKRVWVCGVGRSLGNCQEEAEGKRRRKTRPGGFQQCYGWRRKSTEVLYVGEGLFMMWRRGMKVQEGRHRGTLAVPPVTAMRIFRAIWSLSPHVKSTFFCVKQDRSLIW